MESNDYKMDKLAIIEHKQQIALQEFQQVVDSCNLSPIAFLKKDYDFKKLRDRKTEINIGFLLSIAWTKICALSGLKVADSDEISQDITNMIFSVYSELSIEEIYKAFELERHGVYDKKTEHFQLFNAEYVADILKKYKKWKQETKFQHHISPKKETVTLDANLIDEKTTMDNAIIRKFNEYLELKDIEEPFVYIFDELYERNIIKKPTKEEPEIQMYFLKKLEQAKIQVEEELQKSTSVNKQDRLNFKEELNKIQSGNTDKAQVRAKKNILMEFFKKHADIKTDFEKFIKNE